MNISIIISKCSIRAKLIVGFVAILPLVSCQINSNAEMQGPFTGYIIATAQSVDSTPCPFLIDGLRWSCIKRQEWGDPFIKMKKRVRVFISREAESSISGGMSCPSGFCIEDTNPLELLSNPSLTDFIKNGSTFIDQLILDQKVVLYRVYEMERGRREVRIHCIIIGSNSSKTIDYANTVCNTGLWAGR